MNLLQQKKKSNVKHLITNVAQYLELTAQEFHKMQIHCKFVIATATQKVVSKNERNTF